MFSATEMVAGNKFETEYGRAVLTTKYGEYAARYHQRFSSQAESLALQLTHAYERDPNMAICTDSSLALKAVTRKTSLTLGVPKLRLDLAPWDRNGKNYILRSAGADHQFETDDDMTTNLLVLTGTDPRSPEQREGRPHHPGKSRNAQWTCGSSR